MADAQPVRLCRGAAAWSASTGPRRSAAWSGRATSASDALLTIVALFGTTISPYLFFWQSSQEAEEIATSRQRPIKQDAAQRAQAIPADAVRHADRHGLLQPHLRSRSSWRPRRPCTGQGVTQIGSAADAAEALRPVAGQFAFALFAIGIIGTGLARRSRARRLGRLRRRRDFRLEGRASNISHGRPRASIRSSSLATLDRNAHRLVADRSDARLVLERGPQRHCRGPADDRDDDRRVAPSGDGPLHARPAPLLVLGWAATASWPRRPPRCWWEWRAKAPTRSTRVTAAHATSSSTCWRPESRPRRASR